MHRILAIAFVAVLCLSPLVGFAQELNPVPFSNVDIDSGFWSPRLETNRTVSIPHNLDTCEGRIDNFRHACGDTPLYGDFKGHIFHDSDLYKVLEGVAYSLHTHPDPELEARLDAVIDLIARAQQEDGYVNTWFTVAEPDRRWTNLVHAHELYCAGHMFEAAVAHYRATGKTTFLDVACNFADYIDEVFGDEPGKRHGIPGHPELELALVKLWRATGEDRYLELARFFVEEHGNDEHRSLMGGYCQDHLPVREQTEPVGHAVRFLYFFSGVADLAVVDGDQGYIDAMEGLWSYINDKKMYVTGGVGVQGHGEGFARAYYLPNHDAYCETCASIGMIFWNHRLALLHGEGRYADIVETCLYNGAISGIALDGTKFFYVNPLASRGGHHRQPWFGCACCPTNVVRFISSIGQYAYGSMQNGDGVAVLQYVGGEGSVELNGGSVRLIQETNYPWEGAVAITVEPDSVETFTVQLRIPGWCEGASIQLNGEPIDLEPVDGFVSIRRLWSKGDKIELDFPMPVRRIAAAPEVEENVGRLTTARGPIVYCLEDVDNPCFVDQVAIPEDAEFAVTHEPDLLGGVTTLTTRGVQQAIVQTHDGLDIDEIKANLKAIPYYAWDNREPGRMVVWTPTETPEFEATLEATIAVAAAPTASHCHSADGATALNDALIPENSSDHNIPRFTWWDHRGTQEWIALEFAEPQTLSCTDVYWFDDTGRGQCRTPKSWTLLYKKGDEWIPVENASEFGVQPDQFNRTTFDSVETTGLRIEVQLRENFSGGVLEWRLPSSEE
jgi:uncharacterized protein